MFPSSAYRLLHPDQQDLFRTWQVPGELAKVRPSGVHVLVVGCIACAACIVWLAGLCPQLVLACRWEQM